MNRNISKLYNIGLKQTRIIIGLMSGTSMDGLDIALCSINGAGAETDVKVLQFATAGYSDHFRKQIKNVFSRRDADLQEVCLMNEVIAIEHAKLINNALKKWAIKHEEVDIIASHGQTIFHAPIALHQLENYPDATLQIGDGDHIAVHTGIITFSDFRQKHIAAGGEGAPLAVYGDYLIFSKKGEERILLNIGGIANFTYLPADADASKVFSTDIGPGNTLMDQFMQQNFNLFYDQNASVASSGKVNTPLLDALLSDRFFDLDFPKTTGPELFSLEYLKKAQQISGTSGLSKEDVMATLCSCSATAIIAAIKKSFNAETGLKVYMSGGGMHNPLLVKHLKEGLKNTEFFTTEALNIEPDAKEAVLFAILANEAVAGAPIDFGGRKGIPAVTMGKCSFPD